MSSCHEQDDSRGGPGEVDQGAPGEPEDHASDKVHKHRLGLIDDEELVAAYENRTK